MKYIMCSRCGQLIYEGDDYRQNGDSFVCVPCQEELEKKQDELEMEEREMEEEDD